MSRNSGKAPKVQTPKGVPSTGVPMSVTGEQSGATRDNGKGRRTALQLDRQEQVFRMRVIERMTVRQVAAELKISQQTVIDDERAELQRRADEIENRREVEKAAHLALIDDLYLESMNAKDAPGTGALGAAAKAIEMRAKILGLDAPTKIDIGVQTLVDALDGK